MNVGISVSRVGGSAQIAAMKQVAGGMWLDMAAFRELEAFAQLGTDLDAATQARLDRGYRINELIKQGLCKPMHVIDQVVVIYAGTHGFIDKVKTTDVLRWENDFLSYLHGSHKDLWTKLDEKKKLDDELSAELDKVLEAFNKTFA
jgi:F-type H+-transporting ATPase subunit alpha